MDAAQSGNTELLEVVERPAMWWLTENDYWNAYGLVWRSEGPHQPYMELRAKDWDAMVRACEQLGMTLRMAEDEVKGGHPKQEYPGDPEGTWVQKSWRPTEYHWVRQTSDHRAAATAKTWDELRDFIEEMGVDFPEGPAPTVPDGRVPV